MGPSHKSFEHVKRAYRIAREVGIGFDHFYIVGGCQFPEDLERTVQEETLQQYLGKIAFDELVQESVIAGRSLLDIPTTSLEKRSITVQTYIHRFLHFKYVKSVIQR